MRANGEPPRQLPPPSGCGLGGNPVEQAMRPEFGFRVRQPKQADLQTSLQIVGG
jgi:hypothetical protein